MYVNFAEYDKIASEMLAFFAGSVADTFRIVASCNRLGASASVTYDFQVHVPHDPSNAVSDTAQTCVVWQLRPAYEPLLSSQYTGMYVLVAFR